MPKRDLRDILFRFQGPLRKFNLPKISRKLEKSTYIEEQCHLYNVINVPCISLTEQKIFIKTCGSRREHYGSDLVLLSTKHFFAKTAWMAQIPVWPLYIERVEALYLRDLLGIYGIFDIYGISL